MSNKNRVVDVSTGHSVVISRPVDRVAASVISRGFQYDPDKKVANLDSDLPIPFRSPNALELKTKSFVDLTGLKFGFFSVIGIYQGGSTKRGMRWVCRCVCGRYAVRVTKSLRNPANQQDSCEMCRHSAHLKRKASQQRY